MRTEYVIPLQGKIASRIDQLGSDNQGDIDLAPQETDQGAGQPAQAAGRTPGLDEKLRHAADMRISLDLDDGVKVNYGKFGDLLAEVKAVTGGGKDE